MCDCLCGFVFILFDMCATVSCRLLTYGNMKNKTNQIIKYLRRLGVRNIFENTIYWSRYLSLG